MLFVAWNAVAFASYARVLDIMSSISRSGLMFGIVTKDPNFVSNEQGQKFLEDLSTLIGTKKDPNEISTVLAFAGDNVDPAVSFLLLRS